MSGPDDPKGGGETGSSVVKLEVPARHLDLFGLAIAWKVKWDAERVVETECELRERLSREGKLESLLREELRIAQRWLAFSARLLAIVHESPEPEGGAAIAFSGPAEELLASLEAMAREVIVPRLARLVELGPISTETGLELNAALAWVFEQVEKMESQADANPSPSGLPTEGAAQHG